MALTSTYDKNTKTLTVTKNTGGEELNYSATVEGAEANGATFGSDVTVINATKASKNIAVNLYDATAKAASSSLTSLTLGKGADEITVASSAALNITTGAGKDNITLTTDTTKAVTITDFTAGQDTLVLGKGFDTVATSVIKKTAFSGSNVTLTFGTSTNDTTGTYDVTFTGANGKLINIVNADGDAILSQSFQPAGTTQYDLDNANTGDVLITNASYINGANRKKAVEIDLTGNSQQVLGGSGNDTVVTNKGESTKPSYAVVTGGKGNDTFVISPNADVRITDYTLGGKETIQLSSGMGFKEYRTVGNDVYLTFTDTGSAVSNVILKDAKWNQLAAEKKSVVKIVDSTGNLIDASKSANAGVTAGKGFFDKTEAVISKVDKKDNVFDLSDNSKQVTLASGVGNIDSNTVTKVTFSPSAAASIQAGLTYTYITGGSGKDTLLGGAETPTSKSVTGYITAEDINTSGSGVEIGNSSNRYVKFTVNVGGSTVQVGLGIDSTKNAADRIQVGVLKSDGTTYQMATSASNGSNSVSASDNWFSLSNTTISSTYTLTVPAETAGADPFVFTVPRSILRLTSEGSFASGELTTGAINTVAEAFEGMTYTYYFDPAKATLDGGKGNDYLYSNNLGAYLVGSVGNDTLRGGNGTGVMYGGAGNDVFLLTGEGATTAADDSITYTTHEIKDYYSGSAATYETVPADAKARKSAYGSDKIQIAFDKYNTKAPVAKATLTGGTFEDGVLTLTVEGQSWVESVAAGGVDGTSSVAAHFYGDAGIENSSDATLAADLTAKYAITAKEGDVLTIVDQGITYKQTLEAFDATNSEVKVTANYLGKVNDVLKVIDGSASTKAMRLVAGNGTTSIAGGTKADTLIGNGGTAMTGGNGNDIFWVQDGDSITDYSNTGTTGKDKIQINDFKYLTGKYKETIDTYTLDANWSTPSTVGDIRTWTRGIKDTSGNKVDTISVSVNTSTKVVTTVNYDRTKVVVSGIVSVGDVLDEIDTAYLTVGGNLTASEKTVGENLVARTTNKIGTDGVNIGGITIQAGTGKAITFQQVTETPVYNAKKGTYASTKKTTDTMIRTFSSDVKDSVVSGGASTYLEVFAGLDDNVVAIKGGTKAAKIVNSAKYVNSIVGGAKAETISVGNYSGDATHTDTTITVTSGKGNDVIEWNGNQAAIITDYTTAKFNARTSKMTAGDVLYFTNLEQASDVKVAGFYGNDVVLSSGGTGKVTLTGGKDKTAIFAVGEYTVADTVGADSFATVSLADPHEYLLAKKTDTYAESGNVRSADTATESETWVINASISTKANSINARTDAAAKVGTIYGGKGTDTIYASKWGSDKTITYNDVYHGKTQLIDAGAGNDVIYLNTSSDTAVELVTGAGTDIIAVGSETGAVTLSDYTTGTDKLWFLNDAGISKVETVPATFQQTTTVKGKRETVTETVDLQFTLTNGKTVTFDDVNTSNLKVTRLADNASVPSSKNFFSLDYFNDKITIEAKDFAANTAVDLDGANATDITVAKAAKKVTIEGAQNGAVVSVENGGKNAITFVGNTYSTETNGATYNGSAGADVYYAGGLNASDTVVLGSGNDSILSGGKAHVVSGIGSNVFVLGTGDAYNIDKFSTTDKVVLASTTTLESVSYDSVTSALTIKTSETGTGEEATPVYGTIILNDYKAGNRVNIYQLGTNARGKVSVDAELVRSYGQETLTLAKGDSSTIVISDKTDGSASATNSVVTTKVDATNLGANAIISDTTNNVTTFVGSAKNDTIYAFDAANDVVTTLTGGAGNDVFYLDLAKAESGDSVAKYIITDYGTGKDEIRFNTDDTLKGTQLAAIADYAANYSISGSDIIITDTGIELTIQNGTGKTITLGTNKVTFSDPVNVKLAKNATEVDWSGTAYDTSRVETFDASANTKDAIKFTATGNNFTKFTGNKKGSTVAISANNTVGAEIDLGSAGGTLTLNTNTALADTVKYSGGKLEVTNFLANDQLSGVSLADISSAAVTGSGADASVTFTIKSNTVQLTGAGVKLTATTYQNPTAKESGKTDASSDVFVWTKTYTVDVAGVGPYNYTTTTKETTGSGTAPADDSTTTSAGYKEYYDFISYGDTVYSGQEGDNSLADITEAKVAVDITSTTNPEVDYGTGDVITFSSVVDKTKQK